MAYETGYPVFCTKHFLGEWLINIKIHTECHIKKNVITMDSNDVYPMNE